MNCLISLILVFVPLAFAPYQPVDEYTSLGVWTVTAYCPCAECCGEWSDGRTASNHKIKDGERLVAAPPDIPFGTMLFIPGYGEGRVEDRGGSIKGKRLDVLFHTHQEALEWGRREVEVFKCK